MPFDTLKIDRSFIKDICKNETDKGILDAILLLAHKLNLLVVVEGVEDYEQSVLLHVKDCDYIQGYYYYKPLNKEDLFKVLTQK